MKKLTALFAIAAIAVTMFASLPASAQVAFSDIDASHWAMASVERLVNSGTINGFDDGTFRPGGVVSRAQFVKMLGKSEVKFDKPFSDVPESHWAYDYIMYSRLEGNEEGLFMPDEAIARGDVANLLYLRFANGAKEIAPDYITSQGTDSNATAWVYNTGLMVGSDMLNLRLGDTLTRAEAAVLIVRALDLNPDAKKNFVDNFSDDVYKLVYENSQMFDTPYEADGYITYEELATAAMRFQCKTKTPVIKYYDFKELYDSSKAKYWGAFAKNALDEKGIEPTYEEAVKNATVGDAVAVLTLAARNNEFVESGHVTPNGKYHADVTVKNNDSEYAKNMSYAYNFGLSLYRDGKINPSNLITKRELSCIILQYSLSFGSNIGFSCGYNSEYLGFTTRLDAASYPASSGDYAVIADEIPNVVYDTPYPSGVLKTPRQMYTMTSMIPNTFTTPLMYIAAEAYEKGAEIYLDFFPALVAGYERDGDIMRVRLTVRNAEGGVKLSEILALDEGVNDMTVSQGESVWIDINTRQYSAILLYLDYTEMTIANVIK